MARSGSTRAPDRVTWAVDRLDVQPDDRILEIGCGPGVAVALVCDRLTGSGQITALDRSATAIARTLRRNTDHVAAGRALLQKGELAGMAEHQTFDKAFAVNVNLFWTTDAEPEITTLVRLLRQGATVHLVYDGPGPHGPRNVGPDVAANLERHGFTTEVVRSPSGMMLCVTGLLP